MNDVIYFYLLYNISIQIIVNYPLYILYSCFNFHVSDLRARLYELFL